MGAKGLMGPSLIAFIALSIICLAGTFAVRESSVLRALHKN